MPNDWTADRLLEAWGMRVYGTLRSPIKVSTGGEPSSDDESQAARYVESTEGFSGSSLVLNHVYARMQPLGSFKAREPGEFIVSALTRYGWTKYLNDPRCWQSDTFSQSHLAAAILKEFKEILTDRTRTEPFTPYRDVEEEETREQVEQRQRSEQNPLRAVFA